MEINTGNWDRILEKFADIAVDMGLRIIVAVLIYLVGRFLIRKLVKVIGKMRGFKSLDTTAAGYIITSVKAVLYVILAASIVAVLGVPMSSLVALIASAGVAIGMALQGALGNIAGGIMLLIFRPFGVGDYIVASTGEEGYVRSISLVYTVLTTFDNRRVSVPNGNLMNASISNATAETLRRVDVSFNIGDDAAVEKVQDTIMSVIKNTEHAIDEPAAQVVPTTAIPGGLTYAVRVWTRTSDYWDLHDELMKGIPAALAAEGIGGAATPVKVDNQ